jgi:hypothetical protein
MRLSMLLRVAYRPVLTNAESLKIVVTLLTVGVIPTGAPSTLMNILVAGTTWIQGVMGAGLLETMERRFMHINQYGDAIIFEQRNVTSIFPLQQMGLPARMVGSSCRA